MTNDLIINPVHSTYSGSIKTIETVLWKNRS